MQDFIDVILPIPLEKLFTYHITKAESDFLKPGMRVAVPFGKKKIYTAIVYDIHQKTPEAYEAKDIHQILDEKPIVTQQQLKLWEWIASYYMCTLGDAMRAALPSAFLLESETNISLNNKRQINDDDLSDDEFLVLEALEHQSTLKVEELSGFLSQKKLLSVIKQLLEKQIISLHEELYAKYKPKLLRYVKLND
ncbi:MAG: primosomal protein N', partial [Bacteroidia bacterium]|nr:primosomal protein N' [Bacteroidia bacterium]